MGIIISLIQRGISLYILVLLVYALISWFPGARQSPFGTFISQLAEPYISFFDRLVPSFGGVSFSVVIGMIVLELASEALNIFR